MKMKAFEICDRRHEGKCAHYRHVCTPGMEIDMAHSGRCWRMRREDEKYLQCPDCKTRLMFDKLGKNSVGFGDDFFCPKCNQAVNRVVAIQTIELLDEMHKKWKKALKDFQSFGMNEVFFPREHDTLNYVKIKTAQIEKMIIELVDENCK
jgi:hypothetical protein